MSEKESSCCIMWVCVSLKRECVKVASIRYCIVLHVVGIIRIW